MFKRIFALIVALCLLSFVFTSCGPIIDVPGSPNDTSTAEITPDETVDPIDSSSTDTPTDGSTTDDETTGPSDTSETDSSTAEATTGVESEPADTSASETSTAKDSDDIYPTDSLPPDIFTEESTTAADSATPAPPEEKITSIKFSLFSDFHYKAGMYMSTIADLEKIIKRANDNSVDFIMQTGDFSNDYAGSPELTNTYLRNKYNIPAYGIYGNHELESGNYMEYVTPLLNSDPDSVVWGTPDGKIGDKTIAYYYFELNGFRIICLDTNYSYNPTKGLWEHNYAGSWGYPAGNLYEHSLGPVQEDWLREVLNDAADKDIPCVIFSHMGFAGNWTSTYNHEEIRAIFNDVNKRNPGTVIAAINGHLHTDNADVIDKIVYIDVNTVKNGWWKLQDYHHYTDETFSQILYDDNGKQIGTQTTRLTSLIQGMHTWFFDDPLSAIVTIYSDGTVIVEGEETTWFNDIVPTYVPDSCVPKISSGTYYTTKKNKN